MHTVNNEDPDVDKDRLSYITCGRTHTRSSLSEFFRSGLKKANLTPNMRRFTAEAMMQSFAASFRIGDQVYCVFELEDKMANLVEAFDPEYKRYSFDHSTLPPINNFADEMTGKALCVIDAFSVNNRSKNVPNTQIPVIGFHGDGRDFTDLRPCLDNVVARTPAPLGVAKLSFQQWVREVPLVSIMDQNSVRWLESMYDDGISVEMATVVIEGFNQWYRDNPDSGSNPYLVAQFYNDTWFGKYGWEYRNNDSVNVTAANADVPVVTFDPNMRQALIQHQADYIAKLSKI
jgi:hypothetical protein